MLFIYLFCYCFFFFFGKLVWEVAYSPRVVGDAERAVFVGGSLIPLPLCVEVERRQLYFGALRTAPHHSVVRPSRVPDAQPAACPR